MGFRHSIDMSELRIQRGGHPYWVLFDPRRVALLLIGGDKTGDDRWYDVFVPIADRLYDEHLERLDVSESLARSDEKLKRLREEMALNELRTALAIAQEHLAKILHVRQAAISKLERRADMYVSTLADFIRAMGGELEIVARFPQGRVRISQFQDVRGRPGSERSAEGGDTGGISHGHGGPPVRDAGRL